MGEKLRVSKKVVKNIQNWWSGWSKVVNVTPDDYDGDDEVKPDQRGW